MTVLTVEFGPTSRDLAIGDLRALIAGRATKPLPIIDRSLADSHVFHTDGIWMRETAYYSVQKGRHIRQLDAWVDTPSEATA